MNCFKQAKPAQCSCSEWTLSLIPFLTWPIIPHLSRIEGNLKVHYYLWPISTQYVHTKVMACACVKHKVAKYGSGEEGKVGRANVPILHSEIQFRFCSFVGFSKFT